MSNFYLGQISPFSGNFAIKGSAMCSGQLLSIQQNTALFSILGTFYGGNGVNNFALPDLRGRRANSQGQAPGLSAYTIGQMAGTETVTMNLGNLPSHGHTITGGLSAAPATTAAAQVAATGSVLGATTDLNTGKNAKPAIYCPSGTTANVALGGLTTAAQTGPTGGSQPLGVLNPYLTITMLIWLTGIFPTRN